MRANRVEVAIARYREAGTKKYAHKWGAHTWGFYCIINGTVIELSVNATHDLTC